MDPTILFEDTDVLVVNKPSGLIVYPDGRHDYPSLSEWLTKTYGKPALLQGELSPDVEGFHFVHRLDRETSGVLIVAKTPEAHEFLKVQFAEREVQKTYRAFVYGLIRDERGIIDRPIGNARGGKGPRSATRPHGTTREALTMYKVLGRTDPTVTLESGGQPATYVEVMPKTGRTHQIRVHFSLIQRPIVCDQLYAPSRKAILGFTRLALHALALTVELPPSSASGRASGEKQTFIAPLPADFIEAEQLLQQV